ncbi:MAG: hypothetical protein J0M04_00920 [Verrucomicrobia bacterium]|nr:hypothetical protein [Verrucomicrobiota bacterium]
MKTRRFSLFGLFRKSTATEGYRESLLHHAASRLPLLGAVLIPVGTVSAASIDTAASGNWNAPETWSGATVPQPGAGDTANILLDHTVIYTSASPFAGLNGSNDLGVGNGNTININGGVLSQAMDGWWVRIGHKAAGNLNINDGRFHITDGTGGGTNFMVGVETGGNGTVNIGDGTGSAYSAILNMRDRVDGSLNGGSFDINIAQNGETVGSITIQSDGVLEGDQKTWNAGAIVQNPHIRIGRASSSLQSSLTVNAGGQFNARGNVEVAAEGGSKGLLHLTGTGARMDMSDGEFTVGFTGTGVMTVENGAVFSRTHTSDARSDLFVGRNASGNGTITIGATGEFSRWAGGNVGDLRIGYSGTGVLNVETGGLFHNESGNWDWLGQNAGSNGTVNVNGGTYEITGGTNLIIGLNGTGTFNHNSGSTNVNGIYAGRDSGTGLITIAGGTFNVRGSLFLGGDSTTSAGTGSATVNQSGGAASIGGAFVVGIAANHTGTYNLAGGSVTHTGSDTSVGESGTGTMTIAAGASLTDTSPGQLFVGRNEGSNGTLIVNGTLTKSGGTNPIRVGNGNADGIDNTTAPGLLGGTGTISSAAGVRIGSHGTVTAGLTTTAGTLAVTGDVAFSSAGILHADISGATADLLTVTGSLDITGATLQLAELAPPTADSYVLASCTNTLTGSFTVTGAPAGYAVAYDLDAKQVKLIKQTSTGFAAWATTHGLSGNATDDFDHDSLADAVEYVLGTEPTTANAGGTSSSTPGGDFVFTFDRAHAAMTPDISVDIEVGTALTGWPTVYHVGADTASSSAGVTVSPHDTNDTITLTLPRAPEARQFARMRVTVTP